MRRQGHKMGINDTRMEAKALTQRWPVTAEMRAAIVGRMMNVLISQDSSPREKTSAAKALMSAESQNQKDEQNQQLHSDRNRLLEIADRLGIAGHLGGATEVGADRGDGLTIDAVARRRP